jgi:hypothetical protein
LSVDPLTEDYPFFSPYHFAGNTPIIAIDLDGAEPKVGLPTKVINGVTVLKHSKEYDFDDHVQATYTQMAHCYERATGRPLTQWELTLFWKAALDIQLDRDFEFYDKVEKSQKILMVLSMFRRGGNPTSDKNVKQGGFKINTGGKKNPINTKQNRKFNGKQDTKSQTSKEAFNKAKDQNGIPRSQQPDKSYKVKETSKGKETGKELRQYEYTNSKGEKITIRKDNPTKYKEGGKGDQGEHYNAGSTGEKLDQHHDVLEQPKFKGKED